MTERNIPGNYIEVLAADQLKERIKAVAQEITLWAKEAEDRTGEQVLAVGILRGGVFFFADLLRAISISMEVSFCRASSYLTDKNAQGKEGVVVSANQANPKDRAVLLVDDICDTGATLSVLEKKFYEQGARIVQAAVMIERKVKSPLYCPRWRALEYLGDEWLVGCGLEDRNHYSNLPSVYRIIGK